MAEPAQCAEPALKTKCKSEQSLQADKGNREEIGVATWHPNHRNQNYREEKAWFRILSIKGTRKRPGG